MENVSLLRVWNISKPSPAPAWIKRSIDGASFEVSDGADIADWTAGDVLQVGEPTTVTPGRVIALDISPMLVTLFGTAFPHQCVLLTIGLFGTNPNARLEVSDSGTTGTFNGVRTFTTTGGTSGQVIIPGTVSSPISDSSLIFIREFAEGAALGTMLVSVQALIV